MRLTILAVISLVLAACTSTPTATPTARPVTTPTPPSMPAPEESPTAITLRAAPDNLGCDAIAPTYRSVTFVIDVTAPDQVVARADTGETLTTFWSAGFVGGSSADPVVRDPAGSVVARDGDVLAMPEGAWPRLAGYFVCPSTNALYVLLQDPE